MKSVKFYHVTKPVHQLGFALMIIMYMPFTQDLSLIPKLGPFVFLSRSDIRITSTSHLKTRLATNMFAPNGRLLSPGRIITLRALASKRKQRSSASHVLFNIARQRGPLGPDTAIWACLTASNYKINQIVSCDETCPSANLRIRHVGCHELLGQLSLISKLGLS